MRLMPSWGTPLVGGENDCRLHLGRSPTSKPKQGQPRSSTMREVALHEFLCAKAAHPRGVAPVGLRSPR